MIKEEDLMNVHASCGGILVREVNNGEEMHYGMQIAHIIDPLEGEIKEIIKAPTDGILFFSHTEPLVGRGISFSVSYTDYTSNLSIFTIAKIQILCIIKTVC